MNYYNYYENNILTRTDERIDYILEFFNNLFSGKSIFTLDEEDDVIEFKRILKTNGFSFKVEKSNHLITEFQGEEINSKHLLSPVIGYNETVFIIDTKDLDYLSLFITEVGIEDNNWNALLCFRG